MVSAKQICFSLFSITIGLLFIFASDTRQLIFEHAGLYGKIDGVIEKAIYVKRASNRPHSGKLTVCERWVETNDPDRDMTNDTPSSYNIERVSLAI